MTKVYVPSFLGIGEELEAESPSDMVMLLQRVEQVGRHGLSLKAQPQVTLEKSNLFLHVGLGEEGWFLHSQDLEKGEDIYSLGDPSSSGYSVFEGEEVDRISNKYLISRDVALDEIREWMLSGPPKGAGAGWTYELFPPDK